MRTRDKLDWVRKYAGGKKVLYLGSVDNDRENVRKHGLLLQAVRAFAGETTAACSSEEDASRLSSEGFRALHADLERLELGEKYEVVLSLDNLEHMSNVGSFLDSIACHLTEDGLFLVTTPNPLGLVRIGELLFARRGKANPGHTCWFTGQVLGQLAARYGLVVVDEVAIDDMYAYHGRRPGGARLSPIRFARSMLMAFNYPVCTLFPRFSETYGYVIARRPRAPERRP